MYKSKMATISQNALSWEQSIVDSRVDFLDQMTLEYATIRVRAVLHQNVCILVSIHSWLTRIASDGSTWVDPACLESMKCVTWQLRRPVHFVGGIS